MCDSLSLRDDGVTMMTARKQFLGVGDVDTSILDLFDARKQRPATEAELREQRVSYAFGNAMRDAITKDSVLAASRSVRIRD
ncbi:hypothetical protein ASG29_01080 [Sphingomonas sp. Leaf412]|nr:hypothetical protein ASG29_01080 [Sphingomonas sp. Leaf412]